MISPTSLEEQKFLSLRERVKLLWDEHGLSISKTALLKVYKRYKIEYKKAKTMRKTLLADQDYHDHSRLKIAKQLVSLFINKEPVVYMDETTVRMNDGKHKTWQHQDHTIFAPKNEPQNLQSEVFGAISSPGVLRQPLFMVTHTTDGQEFITFL